MTNRVGSDRRTSETNEMTASAAIRSSSQSYAVSRERPPSSASSVASSTRNPFAPDDFEDTRSTHSESENACPSCPPASAFHQPSAAGHMQRVCSKHAAAPIPYPVMNHRFDPFAFPHPATPYFTPMSPAFDAQFQRTGQPTPQVMCHHMSGHANQMHPMPTDCDCRYYYRHADPRVADMYHHPDLRYQYFQRMQQIYQQQKSAPTEFGSSFDFEPEFESSARSSDMRQYSYSSQAHHDHDPFAPGPDSRCLSPNNPFNPIFGPSERMMSAVLESQYGILPPPRPPARVPEMRRASFESDASPPPLPKRRTQGHHSHHNYHNAPREYEQRNVYACPPGDQNQGFGVAESPPPPLPLPSRKKAAAIRPQMDRRVSFDTPPKPPVDDPNDPFNVSYIDKHLNQMSINKSCNVTSSLEKSRKVQTSTPLVSECGTNNGRPEGLHLSSIKSVSDSDQPSLNAGGLNDTSVFESSSLSSGFDSGGYTRLQDDKMRRPATQNIETRESHYQKEQLETKDSGKKKPFSHFGDDHISPEERNIFRDKDPFENDDFFAP